MLHITDVGGTILNTTFGPREVIAVAHLILPQKSLSDLKLLGKY
jgi:hypothetical protein